MNETEFKRCIKEILLIEGENDMDFPVKIDSLSTLMLIQFYDEKFEKRITGDELKNISSLSGLIELVKDKIQRVP